jgi:hypothetical protein
MTVKLSGPVADLSELPAAQAKAAASTPAAPSPALALDVDADVRIDRLVLPDRRSLGPVSGVAQLSAGALLIKQLSVALGGAKMTVGGTVGQPSKMAALDLQVNVEATRGAGLAAFTGLTLRELPAFTASARLTDVANGYALSALSLTSPAMTVAGDAALTRGPKRLKFSATLHSALLDASSLAQPTVASTEKGAAASGARMISDMALPVDALRAIDAEVELRIDRVKFTDAAPLGPVLVRALVDGGRLQADPIQLTGDAGQLLSASAVIDADLATWDMRLEGKGLDLGAMATRFGYPGLVTGGHSDVLLQFRGRGKTLHAVLGSLDGNARMQIGALRLRNAAISPDRGIVQRTIGLVNPFQDSDPHTEVKCFAANVPIRNGILISDQGIAAETARYNVVLSGSLNLRTEVIDIAVTPIVTGALGVGSASIASIVRVGGTLAAPALGVDAVGAAKSAVSAGVAVMATPWWLADAFLKKARSDAHPCTTALGK